MTLGSKVPAPVSAENSTEKQNYMFRASALGTVARGHSGKWSQTLTAKIVRGRPTVPQKMQHCYEGEIQTLAAAEGRRQRFF